MRLGSGSGEVPFYGFSIACLVAGIAFLVLSVLVWWLARPDVSVLLFGIAMLFGGVANGQAFLVLHRMQSTGYPVGLWRTSLKDLRLYREYWRIAPEKGWSRLPMVAFTLSFILAACFLLSMMYVGGARK
ncbi:MAG TPA: hypothetical protein VMT28_03140 [Terriglobales bacterium]|jgi:hypothetical protein|nr:hypothetical protein [Terriglobales bacterium]